MSELKVGDRGECSADKRRGTVKFIGELSTELGVWVGLELDDPVDKGTDGTKDGNRYFTCRDKHGTFVLLENVTKVSSPGLVSSHDTFNNSDLGGGPAPLARQQSDFDEVARSLNRRVSLRPSAAQIEKMGIVPPKYFDDPSGSVNSRELGHEMASYNLQEFLQRRPSQFDIESTGVVPKDYFQDPQKHNQRKKLLREMVSSEMNDFLPRRKSIQELANANIIPQEFVEVDAESGNNDFLSRQQSVKNELARKLDRKRRPSVADLGDMQIIPSEYIDDILTDAVTQHRRRESRMDHVKDRLLKQNFPDSVANAVAANLVDFVHEDISDNDYEMVDTPDESHAIGTIIEEDKSGEARDSVDEDENENDDGDADKTDEDEMRDRAMPLVDDTADLYPNGYSMMTGNGPPSSMEMAMGMGMMGATDFQMVRMIDTDSDWSVTFVVDPFQGFVPMAPVRRNKLHQTLERRLSHDFRPSPQQLETWGVVPPNYFANPDANVAVQAQKDKREEVKQELTKKLNPARRPSVADLSKEGLIPEDWLYELYGLADDVRKKHGRMESAIVDLKTQLNVPEPLAEVVARDVLDEIERIEPTLAREGDDGPPLKERVGRSRGSFDATGTAAGGTSSSSTTTKGGGGTHQMGSAARQAAHAAAIASGQVRAQMAMVSSGDDENEQTEERQTNSSNVPVIERSSSTPDDYKRTITTLQVELQDMGQKQTEYIEELTGLKRDKRYLEEEIRGFKSNEEDLHDQIRRLERQLNEAKSRISDLESNEHGRSKISSAMEDDSETIREERYREQVKEVAEERNHWREQSQKLKDQLDSSRLQTNMGQEALKMEVSREKERREEAERRCTDLSQKLDESQRLVERLIQSKEKLLLATNDQIESMRGIMKTYNRYTRGYADR